MKPIQMEAHVGASDGPSPNWRAADLPDEVDDDEELLETPADVVDALGFDPLDDD